MIEDNSAQRTKLLKRMNTVDDRDFFEHVPTPESEKSIQEKLQENWKSGATVCLVNLPLCIALSVASGSTPSAGILSGIIGGILSGLVGGSHFNIVGPTGALSGFLLVSVFNYGMNALAHFAIITGLLTLLCKKYKLARYIDLFPTAVEEGFTLGIAFIIFFNQMNYALGIHPEKFKHATEEVPNEVSTHSETTLIHNMINTLSNIDQMNVPNFFVFLLIFVGLLYLAKHYSHIPWHIVAAMVGIIIGYGKMFHLETLQSKFGDLKLKIYDLSYLKDPSITFFLDPRLWIDCLPIAFITVLETLISAKIADAKTKTSFNKDKELFSLGISNLISGVLGGIPITAALARTTLNIKSGATDKISSLINGVMLFIISFLFMPLFKYLPLCVSAAQVCFVAVRMVDTEEMFELYEHDKKNFYLYIATAIICILKDPTIGIIFGMLIYLILFSESLITPWKEVIMTNESRVKDKYFSEKDQKQNPAKFQAFNSDFVFENLNLFVDDLPKEEGDYVLYRIIGIVNFMNVVAHLKNIEKLIHQNQQSTIVISFKYLHYFDYEATCAIKQLMTNIAKDIKDIKNTKRVIVSGISKSRLENFENKEWMSGLHDNSTLEYHN
jgi:SulP family sulfate permease